MAAAGGSFSGGYAKRLSTRAGGIFPAARTGACPPLGLSGEFYPVACGRRSVLPSGGMVGVREDSFRARELLRRRGGGAGRRARICRRASGPGTKLVAQPEHGENPCVGREWRKTHASHSTLIGKAAISSRGSRAGASGRRAGNYHRGGDRRYAVAVGFRGINVSQAEACATTGKCSSAPARASPVESTGRSGPPRYPARSL